MLRISNESILLLELINCEKIKFADNQNTIEQK